MGTPSRLMFEAPASIGLLTISGVIDDRAALAVFSCFHQLAWDKKNVVGLVLRIASEGGSLAAAQAIAETLLQLKAERGLVIAVAVDDIAVSAAFYLALAADHVAVQPAATVGAIGARITRYDASALIQRLGVRDVSVSSALAKGAESSVITRPEQATSDFGHALVDDIRTQFVDWLLQRRGLRSLPEKLTDGRAFTGKVALAHGLVDATGGTAAALAYVVEHCKVNAFSLLHIELGGKKGLLPSLVEALPMGRVLGRLFGLTK